MSTHGAIARQTGPGRFRGVYHHWDSYPSGLGRTLYRIYREVFGCSVERMLEFLIDQHPAGWSTINDADWAGPIGYRNYDDGPCAVCGREHWEHYAQHYPEHGLPEPPHPPDDSRVLYHSYEQVDLPWGPQCYCHGGRHERALEVTEENAAAMGVEYAYVFDGTTMRVLSSYSRGRKMVGLFGCGDPDAAWVEVAAVDLEGPEPSWGQIDRVGLM